MSRAAWSVRSDLSLVLLFALGLGAAVNIWRNFQRGSAAYHRHLAVECERWSRLYRSWAANYEAELRSGSIRDPALTAERRLQVIQETRSALSYDAQAAILAGRADPCEPSPVGWIALHYQTAKNPPRRPHSTFHTFGAPALVREGLAPRSALAVRRMVSRPPRLLRDDVPGPGDRREADLRPATRRAPPA